MQTTLSAEAARFLRTLRVATQTAAADPRVDAAASAPQSGAFFALAAKGVGDWSFPSAGLTSGDGLLRAMLDRSDPLNWSLTLEAQGAVGLSSYAGREARLRLSHGRTLQGRFGPDGCLRLALAPEETSPLDFAAMEIELMDDSR